MDARLHHAAVRCDAQHIRVPTSACVEGHLVRGKDDGDARRRDQCAAGHIVRGKDDRDARDHDLDIEQDHVIRR